MFFVLINDLSDFVRNKGSIHFVPSVTKIPCHTCQRSSGRVRLGINQTWDLSTISDLPSQNVEQKGHWGVSGRNKPPLLFFKSKTPYFLEREKPLENTQIHHTILKCCKQTWEGMKGEVLTTGWFFAPCYPTFFFMFDACLYCLNLLQGISITFVIKIKIQRYKNKIIRQIRNWEKTNHTCEKEIRSVVTSIL